MEKTIRNIFQHTLGETIQSIQEINDLGSVNRVFDIGASKGSYIIRLNDEPFKKLEYQKENWCVEAVQKLGIPSPQSIKTGVWENINFMILHKIEGKNGKLCHSKQKAIIWKKLGNYARSFHRIKNIEHLEVMESEFHKNWQARLEYNITELDDADSLLTQKIFTLQEHQVAREILACLRSLDLPSGLVHGDLCPRNVIWAQEQVWLLDWGTAEINVVPHIEIGTVMMSNEASEKEFQLFLEGLGISSQDFKNIEREIHILNFLHWLDKYRWAEAYDIQNINDYQKKIIDTFDKII